MIGESRKQVRQVVNGSRWIVPDEILWLLQQGVIDPAFCLS
jgi:hypothetical protein